MLYYLILALICGVLAFGGLIALPTIVLWIAKILCIIFIILAVLALLRKAK